MEYVQIDHVFNYIPQPIRIMFSDDDQLISWAFQAWTSLNDKRLSTVKDFDILDVVNHKVTMPTPRRRILRVRKYVDTLATADCLDEICDAITLPNNDSFASPCSVNMKHFIESEFFGNAWIPVIRVRSLTENYLCDIENVACEHVWSMKPGSNVASFSFCESTIAVEFETLAKDANGDLMLPIEPEVLWMYLGAYVKWKFWDWQYQLSKDGALQRKREYQTEAAVLRTDVKTALIHLGVSAHIHRHLVFDESRLMKLPSLNQRLANWRSNTGLLWNNA